MKNNILKLFLLLTVLCVAVMGFTACLLEGVQHDHSTPSEESSISGSEDSDVIPEKETVNVTIPSGEGFAVEGEAIATKGESYEFSVTFMEGYEGGIVKVNGEAVALNAEGKAIVENVAEELIITVEGVQRMVLSVTFEGEHLTLNGENSVIYSDSYSFVITFESAYEAGADFKVLVNGVELFANAEGEYVIEEAKENIAITVTGAVLKKSAVLEDNEFENEDDWWL